MCDVRIWYLKTLDERQCLIPVLWSVGLTACAVYGILQEKSVCANTTKVWLMGALAREWLWTFVFIANRMKCPGTRNARLMRTVTEGLTIYGIVWAMLMSIAVLPMYKCAGRAPVLFSCCAAYIACFLLHFFVQVAILISLSIRPPTSIADREYLMQRRIRYADDNAPIGANENINPVFTESWKEWLEKYGSYETVVPPPGGREDSTGLSNLRSDSLGGRPRKGTAETDLRTASMEEGTVRSSYDDMELGHCCGMGGGLLGLDIDTEPEICVICLQPLVAPPDIQMSPSLSTHSRQPLVGVPSPLQEESKADSQSEAKAEETRPVNSASPSQPPVSVVVRFPCRGAHCFHAECLHRWLAANTSMIHRRQRRNQALMGASNAPNDLRDLVTCPVCREKPTPPPPQSMAQRRGQGAPEPDQTQGGVGRLSGLLGASTLPGGTGTTGSSGGGLGGSHAEESKDGTVMI